MRLLNLAGRAWLAGNPTQGRFSAMPILREQHSPIRILTCLATLEVGGSQISAIEIAAAVSKMGHEVLIYGPQGELVDMVRDLGLEYIEAPAQFTKNNRDMSVGLAHDVWKVARRRRVDLIHTYEFAPIIDAMYGAHLLQGTPLVMTVYSVNMEHWVPTHPPLILCTEEMATAARQSRPWVELIESPVDTVANAPAVDTTAARARMGIAPDETAVVVVSRLHPELKREGILSAIEAVGRLTTQCPRLRFFVVGDGPSRPEIEGLAASTNARIGREVVTLTGTLTDPRDAYAASDIMLGMGSSALRSMAFAKPLIVQGERAFWRLAEPDTVGLFLHQGWYGIGDGGDGSVLLERILERLIKSPERWKELGTFGRDLITRRFSLEVAAKRQEGIYLDALRRPPGLVQRASGVARATARYLILSARGYGRRPPAYRGSS